MNESRKFRFVMILIVLTPFIFAGGYGEERSGCSSCDSSPESTSLKSQSKVTVPPSECAPFLSQERQSAYQRGLEQGRRQAQVEKDQIEAPQMVPSQSRTRVIGTYKVPRGGSFSTGVRKLTMKGADFDATMVCNGHKIGFRGNIHVQVGQRLKICGWKD